MLLSKSLFGLLSILAVFSSVNSQLTSGFSSSPFYVATFDAAPTPTQVSASKGGFSWINQSSGRQGAAYLNRRDKQYIDVGSFPDNYGRTVGIFGNETSVEMWVYHRDFTYWMRLFDFAVAPVDALGVPTANPTSDRFTLQHGSGGAPTYLYGVGRDGVGVTEMAPNSIYSIMGEWIHIACVTEAIPGVNETLPTAGRSYVYVNGLQAANFTSYLPRVVARQYNDVGRSSYWRNGDAYEQMFLDTFAMYSYPLSGEAVYAHMKTSRPPQYELVFNKNPASLTGAVTTTYTWSASNAPLINGVLSFDGVNQYVDMLTTSGSSSAATAVPATWNGASGTVPAFAPGASYTAIVKFNALTATAPVFDMKGTGTNRVRMHIAAAGNVVFTLNSLIIASTTTVSTNTWYHLAASVSASGNGTLYINNVAAGTSTGTALTAATYTSAFLACSTDATPVYLNGMIDAVRFYDIALSAAEVSGLHSTIVRAPNALGEEPRLSPAPSASPVVGYTFSKPSPAFGEAGMSNYTVLDSLLGRKGMAYFDGSNSFIQLKDHADDEGRMIPTMFGGAMAFESTFQFRDSSNQANVWSFSGGRGQNDYNILLQNTYLQDPGNINSIKIESYGDRTQAQRSVIFCSGCTNGSWVHAVMTIEEVNFDQPNMGNSSLTTLYMNGILVGSQFGWMPPVVYRPALFLGQSSWPTDSLLAGQIDSFYWYNVEMSAEAVAAHYALPKPPSFELAFAVDPRRRANNRANAAYGWSFNDSVEATSSHKGNLVLTAGQFIDLAATSGPNFIGFTIPSMTGTERNTPGVDAAQANGWSVETAFYPQSVAQGVTVFELGNADGSNSIRLSFTTAGQLTFTNGVGSLSCGTIVANTWVDIAIAVTRDGDRFEASCYVNSERVGAAIAFPEIAFVARTSQFLGKAITGSNTNFIGQFDSFRIMPYAITSDDAAQLFESYSRIGRLSDPPAFASGPIASWSFDTEPLVPSDPSSSITYNYYNWKREGTSYYGPNVNRTGLAVFDGIGTSHALRQYVDLNFDQDSYGRTMPQIWGQSMSFEVMINMGALRQWQRVFDCGDDETADVAPGDAIGKWNIWLGQNAGGLITLLHYYGPAAWTELNIPLTASQWRPGTWQHVVAQIENTGVPTATTAILRVYLDGVMIGSAATTRAPNRMRRACFLGRSNWNDNALNGTVDYLNFYNYALSQTQIRQHMVLPNPAQFDASFDVDPSMALQITNPQYSWGNVVGGDNVPRGQIIFNGINQFVNLNSGRGNTSIGQNFPLINGPSIGIDQEGFSLELSARWSNLAVNSKVLDIGSARGVDSLAIGNNGNIVSLYVHNGLTDTQDVIDLFTATAETFYHLVIVGTPVFNSTTRMNYNIYHSGNLVQSMTNKVAPLYLTRRRAYLGRSNTPSATESEYFSGAIDLLRCYGYALRPNLVNYLYSQQGTSGPYVAPTRPVSSSTGAPVSSTAVPSSSSSSFASSSSSQPSSSSSSRSSSSSTGSLATSSPSSSSATSASTGSPTSQPSSTSSPVTPTSSPVTPTSSPVVPTSSPVQSSTGTTESSSSTGEGVIPESSSSSSLGAGPIAGIVIGTVCGVALLCCVVFCLCFSGRQSKSVKLEDDMKNRGAHRDDSTYDGETGHDEVEMA